MYKTAQRHKLSREKKAEIISWLKQQFETSKCIILTNFDRLTVLQANKLRRDLTKLNSLYKVVKNQLFKKVLMQTKLDELQPYVKGNLGIVICNDENNIIPSIKYLVNYSKENAQLKILAGYVYKTIVDKKKIEDISKLPSREEIIAKLISLLALPIQRLYSVLNLPVLSLLNILQVRSKKGGQN